jgi:DNA-binding response OmpR family regulator
MNRRRITPTALIVAHNPWTRFRVAQRLLELGYAVQQSSNGFSGLRLALASAPDLILLVEDLPELNGNEVRHALSEQRVTARARVVLISKDANGVEIMDLPIARNYDVSTVGALQHCRVPVAAAVH